MSLLAMAFLWTGSQIPIYLFGGIPPIIYADIGGLDRWTWFVLGALIALAAVCPFVGSMSDLFGRRYVALAGATILIVGVIIMSTAKTMNNFIAGSVLTGAGAAINELTAVSDSHVHSLDKSSNSETYPRHPKHPVPHINPGTFDKSTDFDSSLQLQNLRQLANAAFTSRCLC